MLFNHNLLVGTNLAEVLIGIEFSVLFFNATLTTSRHLSTVRIQLGSMYKPAGRRCINLKVCNEPFITFQ